MKFIIDMENIDLENLIKSIRLIHKEMEKYVIRSGIPKLKYRYLIKKVEKYSLDDNKTLYTWLLNFYHTAYLDVKRAFNYVPEHVWENHKILFGEHSMPEQIHLNRYRKVVRTEWAKNPIKDIKKQNIKKQNIKKQNIKKDKEDE